MARTPLTMSLWNGAAGAPVRETTVGSILAAAAAEAPERPAMIAWGLEPGVRQAWNYRELEREARRTAAALLERFRPDEHIAVYAPNLPEWLLLELGAGLAGLVLVTVNPSYRARELEYVLGQSRSVGLFHVRQCRGNPLGAHAAEARNALPALREVIELERWQEFVGAAPAEPALPPVAPGDAAQIQYTSGTTGAPKGACLHHRGLTNNARLWAELVHLDAEDTFAHAMPFFHTAGCAMSALGAIQARAAHAFLPGFDAARLLELIERERATVMLAVPTMLIAMLEHPECAKRDLSCLRLVASGGALVPPEVIRGYHARCGARFSIVYGQTEASPLITSVCPEDSEADAAFTIGRPMPATDVKIVDLKSGAAVPVGEIGELCARGYLVMQGYHDRPDATAAAIDPEGWLHTGDLASMDERGYCRITGRLKDMVIRGGENLFPAEIEAALHEHPDVVEAAVIGVADHLMGEELAAFVRTGARRPAAMELHAHVRARLAAPKAPRYWVYVDAYPLTASGKIQKFALRERWERGDCQPIDTHQDRRASGA